MVNLEGIVYFPSFGVKGVYSFANRYIFPHKAKRKMLLNNKQHGKHTVLVNV